MKKSAATALLMACAFGPMATSLAGGDEAAKLPAGFEIKELNDQQDERAVLAKAMNAAMTKGGFDDLVERLATPDRKRMGEFSENEFKELDGRIEQIRKNWKQKYGKDFDASSDKLLDGFVSIVEAEVTNPTMARANWPVACTSGKKTDGAANSIDSANALETGTDVALVTIPKSHEMRSITISMIHEPVDDWRIDLPDSISGQQVYGNVKTALTQVGDNVAHWPGDVNEAYRFVGHTVFMALYDVPVEIPKAKQAGVDR